MISLRIAWRGVSVLFRPFGSQEIERSIKGVTAKDNRRQCSEMLVRRSGREHMRHNADMASVVTTWRGVLVFSTL